MDLKLTGKKALDTEHLLVDYPPNLANYLVV